MTLRILPVQSQGYAIHRGSLSFTRTLHLTRSRRRRVGDVEVDLLKGWEAGARRHTEINIEDPSSATEALGLLGYC